MPRARPLEKDEAEQRAEVAHGLYETVKAALAAGRTAMWAMAEALYEFDEGSHWLSLNHDTLGEWLAQPEINMTRRTYYRCVSAWRRYHVMWKLDAPTLAQLDLTKADIIAPAVEKGRVKLKDAIGDIRELSANSLRENVREALGRPESASQIVDDEEEAITVDMAEDGGPSEAAEYPYWEELRDKLIALLDADKLRKDLAAVALPAIREVDQALGLE
jgi:hypothetical protein